MSKLVLTNPKITVNSVDLTGYIAQVSLEMSFAEVDTTDFGSGGVTERIAGLGDHSFTASFHQSFAANLVEQTIYPLLGTTTNITVKPVNATTTTTNPEYQFTVLVNGWSPVSGAVGDLLTADVTWPVSGAVVKATN